MISYFIWRSSCTWNCFKSLWISFFFRKSNKYQGSLKEPIVEESLKKEILLCNKKIRRNKSNSKKVESLPVIVYASLSDLLSYLKQFQIRMHVFNGFKPRGQVESLQRGFRGFDLSSNNWVIHEVCKNFKPWTTKSTSNKLVFKEKIFDQRRILKDSVFPYFRYRKNNKTIFLFSYEHWNCNRNNLQFV